MDWILTHWMHVLHVALIVVAVVAINFIAQRVFRRLEHYFGRKDHNGSFLLQSIFIGLSGPFQLLASLVGLYLILWLFDMSLPSVYQLGIVLCATWFLVRTTAAADRIFRRQRRFEPTQVEAVSKMIILVVLLTATLWGLDILGVDMTALLAIGGLGTLAVGLAGKDVFANLFSGFMLYFTRPFKIGDYITSPDRPIDGIIEHIGWYFTRIMTLDKKPTYLPNSIFSTVTISNFSRMTQRRIKETIGFRYCDLPVLREFMQEVRQMLYEHSDIDERQNIFVHLTGYGDYSLDVLIQAVTRCSQWGKFLEVREDVLLKVADLARKHGADFAFPTTTIDMPGADGPSGDEL